VPIVSRYGALLVRSVLYYILRHYIYISFRSSLVQLGSYSAVRTQKLFEGEGKKKERDLGEQAKTCELVW